jgi:hypothetical protein
MTRPVLAASVLIVPSVFGRLTSGFNGRMSLFLAIPRFCVGRIHRFYAENVFAVVPTESSVPANEPDFPVHSGIMAVQPCS